MRKIALVTGASRGIGRASRVTYSKESESENPGKHRDNLPVGLDGR